MTRYWLFGLTIESAIQLPDLTPIVDGEAADVVITVGAAAPIVEEQLVEPVSGGGVFAVTGVARYEVGGGNRIRVTPDPDADPRNVRLFLQGSALGVLLHQRGLLPLHANAVAIDGRAIAFMGESGAGKSTLAAWFHDRGYPLLSDDVCVVTLSKGGAPMAWPGLPRLRLWREVVLASGRDPALLEPSFTGEGAYDKFDVPMAASATAPHPLWLGGVFLLAIAETVAVSQMTGTDAVEALFAHTYRGGYVASAGHPRAHWRACLAIAGAGLVHRLERPLGHDRSAEVGEAILTSVRAALAR